MSTRYFYGSGSISRLADMIDAKFRFSLLLLIEKWRTEVRLQQFAFRFWGQSLLICIIIGSSRVRCGWDPVVGPIILSGRSRLSRPSHKMAKKAKDFCCVRVGASGRARPRPLKNLS